MADELDKVWKALSDATRRSILDLLRGGPKTTTEIVAEFPDMTRFAVMSEMFWGGYFGAFGDKFGVKWMINQGQ